MGGVVGFAAACLKAVKVVATDLPYTMHELQESAKLNHLLKSSTDARCSSLEIDVLDWSQPADFLMRRPQGEQFDVLLGADVIWLMELVPLLVGALHTLCKRNSGADVLIVHQTRAANVE